MTEGRPQLPHRSLSRNPYGLDVPPVAIVEEVRRLVQC